MQNRYISKLAIAYGWKGYQNLSNALKEKKIVIIDWRLHVFLLQLAIKQAKLK